MCLQSVRVGDTVYIEAEAANGIFRPMKVIKTDYHPEKLRIVYTLADVTTNQAWETPFEFSAMTDRISAKKLVKAFLLGKYFVLADLINKGSSLTKFVLTDSDSALTKINEQIKNLEQQ